MLLICGVGEDSWESLGLQGDPTSPFWRRSALDFCGRNDAKAEAPVLWPPHAKSWLIGKDSDAGGIEGRRRRGQQRMRWLVYHWLNGCESEWTPGVGDGQGGLACCDSWGRKESDMTERLNWTDWPLARPKRPLETHVDQANLSLFRVKREHQCNRFLARSLKVESIQSLR